MSEAATTIEQALKDQRVAIDACIKRQKELTEYLTRKPGLAGRYSTESMLRLMDAKMWCGQVLGELGSKLPEEFRDEYTP
jgi:hypothetical protein